MVFKIKMSYTGKQSNNSTVAMDNFMNAMNDQEIGKYLAHSNKPREKLDEVMENTLRVTVHNLYLEAMREKENTSAPPTPKVRFQNNDGYRNVTADNAMALPIPPRRAQNYGNSTTDASNASTTPVRNYQNALNYGNANTGGYFPNPTNNFNFTQRTNEQNFLTPGNGERDAKTFMLTINSVVAGYLNDKDIPRLIREKFPTVNMKAYPHDKKPGCTFVTFFGTVPRDLADAEDEMWQHLRSQQTSRIVLDNRRICDMWKSWNGRTKTSFRNKTNSTVDITDVEGEVIIRAFTQEHLHKVQRVLDEYSNCGLRPDTDKDLTKKMWFN